MGFGKYLCEFCLDVLIAYTTRGRFREHDEGGGKGESAECGEHAALYTVPRRGEPGDLFRDNDGIALDLLGKDRGKVFRGYPPAGFEDGGEKGAGKSFSTGEHGVRRRGSCVRSGGGS